jgi:hypothetical protein
MSVTHATATRTALADKIDDYVNTGAGTAKLRIRASTTTLVDFNLSNPAFGNAASGVITLNSTPITATASATGTADGFQVLDRDGTVVFSGSVTATSGGGDIEATNTSITNGQSCQLTSLTYTAPA